MPSVAAVANQLRAEKAKTVETKKILNKDAQDKNRTETNDTCEGKRSI